MVSLSALEKLILEKNINETHDLFDDVASYIGELVRNTYGGNGNAVLIRKILYSMDFQLFLILINMEFC